MVTTCMLSLYLPITVIIFIEFTKNIKWTTPTNHFISLSTPREMIDLWNCEWFMVWRNEKLMELILNGAMHSGCPGSFDFFSLFSSAPPPRWKDEKRINELCFIHCVSFIDAHSFHKRCWFVSFLCSPFVFTFTHWFMYSSMAAVEWMDERLLSLLAFSLSLVCLRSLFFAEHWRGAPPIIHKREEDQAKERNQSIPAQSHSPFLCLRGKGKEIGLNEFGLLGCLPSLYWIAHSSQFICRLGPIARQHSQFFFSFILKERERKELLNCWMGWAPLLARSIIQQIPLILLISFVLYYFRGPKTDLLL